MLWLVVIVGVAGLVAGCLYARERRKRIAAEAEAWDCGAEADRLAARLEGCRLAAQEAIAERDAALIDRDEWAKHAGEARGDAENARRELEVARQDFGMKSRAAAEAVATGQRREKQAADLLDEARTVLSP